MKRIILSILFLGLFAVQALAYDQNIYIDASVGDGGNGSQFSPYNELSDLVWNSIIEWINAGDTVYINLKRGSEFRQELDVGASGVSGRPITIQAYGTGDKPIINGSDSYTTSSYRWSQSSTPNEWYLETTDGGDSGIAEPGSIWINGRDYERGTLGSLNTEEWIWGDYDSLGFNTIYIYYESDPDTAGIKIEGSQRSFCVRFGPGKAYVKLDNLELKQNGTKTNGNWTYNSATLYLYEANNITVTNSDIHDAGGLMGPIYLMRSQYNTFENNAIFNYLNANGANGTLIFLESNCTAQSSYNIFKNNTIYANENNMGDGIGNTGAWNGSNVCGGSNNLYEYNEVYNSGGNGIYNRSGTNNNIARFNYIHDVDGIAFQIRDNANNNLIHHNIVVNVKGPVMQSDGKNGGPGSVDPSCDGNKFYNNTVYNGDLPGANSFHLFGNNTNLEFKNNIVVSNSGDIIMIGASLSDNTHNGITMSNNRYYKTTITGQEFVYRGVNYLTLSDMVSQMTADGYPNELNSSYGDPMFSSEFPTKPSDIYLKNDSPLIDSGINILGLNKDFFGKPLPQGDTLEIGAYEYAIRPEPPSNLHIVK
jgi:hypothetical protein